MSKKLALITLVGVLAIIVVSVAFYRQSADSSPEPVLKLGPDEVVALLGIKEKDGVKVDEIESGRDGVKVKSISMKSSDGTEVEIQDIRLQIKTTGRLAYALTSMQIRELDVLDWKTTQRVQVFAIEVDKPGEKFLSKLEAMISSLRSGESFKSGDLICAHLGIDRIDYTLRSKDANVTKVQIEALSISDASNSVLGEFAVKRVGVGENVTGKGLKVVNVNREWADRLMGLLVTKPAADAATPGGVGETAAARKGEASAKLPLLSLKAIPFDHFEVAQISFTDKTTSNNHLEIGSKDLSISVDRRSEGRLAATIGVYLSLSVGEFSVSGTDNTGQKGRFLARGLKFTNVDSEWADNLLSPVVAKLEGGSTASTGVSPRLLVMNKRVAPFDRFEIADISLRLNLEEGRPLDLNVSDLHLGVERRPEGQFQAVHGGVSVSLATKVFAKDEEAREFFRAFGNPKLEELLTCDVQFDLTLDQSRDREVTELTVRAPGFAILTESATTRGLLEILNRIKSPDSFPTEDQARNLLTVSSLRVEARDDSIAAFLLSDRFKHHQDVRKFVREIADKWPVVAERSRLSSEINRFVSSPRSVTFTADSANYIPVAEFFEGAFQESDKHTRITRRLSFISK